VDPEAPRFDVPGVFEDGEELGIEVSVWCEQLLDGGIVVPALVPSLAPFPRMKAVKGVEFTISARGVHNFVDALPSPVFDSAVDCVVRQTKLLCLFLGDDAMETGRG